MYATWEKASRHFFVLLGSRQACLDIGLITALLRLEAPILNRPHVVEMSSCESLKSLLNKHYVTSSGTFNICRMLCWTLEKRREHPGDHHSLMRSVFNEGHRTASQNSPHSHKEYVCMYMYISTYAHANLCLLVSLYLYTHTKCTYVSTYSCRTAIDHLYGHADIINPRQRRCRS